MDEIHTKKNETHETLNLSYFSQFICHRIPERTFQIKGHYFPVCSRCTGFYIGAFSYFIYAIFNFIDYSLILIIIGLMIILPLFIDGLTQFMGLRESNNFLRFITGILAGFGAAMVLIFIKIIIL